MMTDPPHFQKHNRELKIQLLKSNLYLHSYACVLKCNNENDDSNLILSSFLGWFSHSYHIMEKDILQRTQKTVT